jgi:hypothetical protein
MNITKYFDRCFDQWGIGDRQNPHTILWSCAKGDLILLSIGLPIHYFDYWMGLQIVRVGGGKKFCGDGPQIALCEEPSQMATRSISRDETPLCSLCSSTEGSMLVSGSPNFISCFVFESPDCPMHLSFSGEPTLRTKYSLNEFLFL